MIGIDLICVGKLKEKFFAEAVKEYEKRLSAYCKLNITEISENVVSSQSEIAAALSKEGEKILAKIPNSVYVVAMCIEGENLSSEALSKKMSELKVGGNSKLVFLIGGSNGLSDEVKARANLRLSMSKMTFPHHLARVMVLEQIYRAFKIEEGSGYHK